MEKLSTNMGSETSTLTQRSSAKDRLKKIASSWQLYVLILPAFIYFIVFHYGPMYGVQIAFKNYMPSLGI